MAAKAYKVRRKTRSNPAVKFTGKNAKEIAEWIREQGGNAKIRGRRIDIVESDGSSRSVKSGDIVISSQGLLSIVSEKEFAEEFYPVKAFSEV